MAGSYPTPDVFAIIGIMTQPPAVLTIAGSDSGGAAGLQADLKTWTVLGVYGMSAVTAVTAQNSERVVAVEYLPPLFVAAQIDAVLSDYGAAAVKTGFLGRVDLIETVADRLAYWRGVARPFIVVDPVLVNHRGEAMFSSEVAAVYRRNLFPLADLVTPNLPEAQLLNGRAALDPFDEPGMAEYLSALGAAQVLLTGARQGEEIIDILWDGGALTLFRQAAVETVNLHGSGDTLSAAVCAYMAGGLPLHAAIEQAQAYTRAAIGRAAGWRLGAGHGPLGHWPDNT